MVCNKRNQPLHTRCVIGASLHRTIYCFTSNIKRLIAGLSPTAPKIAMSIEFSHVRLIPSKSRSHNGLTLSHLNKKCSRVSICWHSRHWGASTTFLITGNAGLEYIDAKCGIARSVVLLILYICKESGTLFSNFSRIHKTPILSPP